MLAKLKEWFLNGLGFGLGWKCVEWVTAALERIWTVISGW